jgi:histidine ammonia-lyase
MGTIGARKAREILENTKKVIAMELMGACQAIDIRGKSGLGMGTEEAYRIIRDRITTLENDRIMYTDINMAEEIVQSWEIVSQVESKVGELR